MYMYMSSTRIYIYTTTAIGLSPIGLSPYHVYTVLKQTASLTYPQFMYAIVYMYIYKCIYIHDLYMYMYVQYT